MVPDDATDELVRLAQLRAASRAFAQATGVDAVLESLIQRTLAAFDAQGAFVAMCAADDTLEVLASTYGETGRAFDGVPLAERLPITDAVRLGEPVWLGRRAELEARYPKVVTSARSAAWAALPLAIGERVIGGLSIAFSREQTWDDAQRLYLLTLADLCAIVLDRHVLAEQRAEHRLRALVDSNVIGVIGGDTTHILEANDAFLEMIGLDQAAFGAGMGVQAITAPGRHTVDDRAVPHSDDTGRFGPYEREVVHADGHRVPVRIVGALISKVGRGRWIALVEDLTDERRIARELRAREARYRSLVEASDTIVWIADRKGRFTEVNDAWSAYTGQSQTDAEDLGWLDALHHEDRAQVCDALDDMGRERRSWQGSARVRHAASGAYRRAVVRAVPLLDDDGEIIEWVGTVTDVDDYARTQEVLRATTARLAALMRHAPVGFAFIDQELRFQVVNEKLAEINGLAADAHLGRDVREVVPDLAEVNESLFRRVLRGEPILETEVTGATPADPDRPRDWLVNYYPVRDDTHGAILGIGATVVDVTERNQLLAAERHARSTAEASARLSESLSAITAATVNAADDDVIARQTGEALQAVFGADGVLITRCDSQGVAGEVLFAHGYTDDEIAALQNDADQDSWSTTMVLRARVPVFYEFPEQFLARFPQRGPVVERFDARSWSVAPLVAANQVIGFFVLMFRSPHRFTSDERRFVATVGDVISQAMLRARSRASEVLARRSAEMLAEAIAAERARLAAVLHRMPAGLVVVDAMGGVPRVVLWNTRAAEILGPPPADDDAETWFAIGGLDGDAVRPATALQRALRGEELGEGEDVLVTREDGTTCRIRTTAVPIRDAEQRITSAVLIIEDVTEQTRRERDAHLLARVAELLGSSGEVPDLLERVVGLAVPSFSDLCGVYVLDADALHLFAVADRSGDRAGRIRDMLAQPIPLRSDTPVADAVRHGRSLMITKVPEVIETLDLDPDQRDWVQDVLRPRSLLVVPLRSGDRVTGALTFAQTAETGRLFTVDDLDVAIELGTRCALLLEQVVAHRETADARDRADGLQRFAAAMARAATVDAVVQAIAADGLDAVGGTIVNVAMRSQADTSLDVLQTWLRRRSGIVSWEAVKARTDTASLEALHTGRSIYYRDLGAYRTRFGDGELSLIAHGVKAVAAIPLRGSDGQIFGSIGFSYDAPQALDPEQVSFLETVADIAGQSLDRARMYERERDVARALQMALLPAALPELDDVTTEARYVAGGAGVSVGGDWYDVLRFTDGRVGLLIGDAAGRGVEAATLMGKTRHAAAALAMERTSPAAVLSRVNEYLQNISSRRTMLTCCYIVLDRDRGILRYSSAGHPPPLIIEGDTEAHFLSGGRGVPLGVVPAAAYTDAEYQLRGPATIVLYTDGLVERRGETIDVGLERLRDAVRGHGVDVEKLCDHLTRTLLSEGCDDDVALLAARVQSLASARRLDVELPADSRRLHELRTRMGRWLEGAGVATDVAPDIVIAVNEAASNSMVHAYASAQERGHVRVALTVDEHEVTAVVFDDGQWRERDDRHDGRGLELMAALMTEVRVERTDAGTRVRLTRRLPA